MAPGINSLYRFDEFELNPQKRTFERQGRRVLLSPKAFEVLTYLVANPERVVTKEELMKAVWPESFVEESNLAQHISWLRKALADRAGLIATIPGRGYQFTAPVDFLSPADLSPADLPPGSPAVLQRVTERTRIVIEETEPGPATDPRQLGTGRGPKPPPIWIVVAMATLLVGVGAFYYAKQNANPPPERKVVVAEFANSTGDTAFDRTLKRALEIELAQSPYMDVMGEGETVNTLRLMGQESGTAITPPIAKELCVRSNRDVLVSGAIASVGRDYLLTLVATDCNSGKQISAALAEAQDKEKVLAALDAVADHLRKGLGESKVSLERFQVPIAQATTSSLDALKAYSMGYSFDGSNTQRLLFFQKAVELDPQFAMAYSAMGSAYYNEGEAKLAALNFQKAFDLSDHVSEREKIIIQTHYYAEGRADLNKGIEAFQLWADTYPHDYVPWVDLANQYNVLGQYPAAIAAGQKALQMEPGKALNYSILARAYAHANRFEEAKSTAELAIQKKIDYDGIHATLFDVAFAQHDQAALERETEWAQEHPSSWYSWYFVDRQAEAAASAGKYKEAQDLFHKAHDVAVRENLTEAADIILMDEAQKQLAVGLVAAARTTLAGVNKIDQDAADYALLEARSGDNTAAARFLAAKQNPAQSGTIDTYIDIPKLKAALALNNRKPLDAIAALEPAAPYELPNYSIVAQRADAYIMAKQGELAAREYQKILANPGVDPFEVLYPLAHLGLARAALLQKNSIEARKQYETFLALWKNADLDIPVLRQARAEYAALE